MFWNWGVWIKSLLRVIFLPLLFGALSFQEVRRREMGGCYKTLGASEEDP